MEQEKADWNLQNPAKLRIFFEKCEIIWKLQNSLENVKHLSNEASFSNLENANILEIGKQSGKCETSCSSLVFRSTKYEIIWKLFLKF